MNEEIKDTYNTITTEIEGEIFKDKGSKFIGYAYPISQEEQVRTYIDILKKQHHTARHWCYAWQLGVEPESIRFRANDDGEPNNSAGNPIYGQILSKDVTNILIVVVRYFGGTKLGVGGLINAYRTAAEWALDDAEIIEKTIDVHFVLKFGYVDMNKVMRIIKENKLETLSQKMEVDCEFTIVVRKKESQKIEKLIENLRCVKFVKL